MDVRRLPRLHLERHDSKYKAACWLRLLFMGTLKLKLAAAFLHGIGGWWLFRKGLGLYDEMQGIEILESRSKEDKAIFDGGGGLYGDFVYYVLFF